MMNRIAPDDQDMVYGCFQNGGCYRSEDGGETTQYMKPRFAGSRFNWVSPLEIAKGSPDTVYFGSNVLNRSDDDGKTWRAVSPDLTDGPTANNASSYATITTIGIAPTDEDVVYVGTDDGNVWTTKDGGGTWNQVEDPQFPEKRWVTRMTVDPDDADRAWLTFSGWRNESEAIPHVFSTTDGGTTWTDVSGNLPDAPVNDVIRHPTKKNQLFVATDVGVFTSPTNGNRWFKVGSNLPVAPIMDIHIQEESSQLFAATFGRSIYKAQIK